VPVVCIFSVYHGEIIYQCVNMLTIDVSCSYRLFKKLFFAEFQVYSYNILLECVELILQSQVIKSSSAVQPTRKLCQQAFIDDM